MPTDETQRQETAMERINEGEVRERLLEALDRFLDLGFAVHLVSVRVRSGTNYTLALYPDGTDTIPSAKLQEVADEFRLDYEIERDPSLDGWAIVLYPRW